jgi:hypothetical protein
MKKGFMRQANAWLLAMMLTVACAPAAANFHTFAIEQVYSNADGTIQFVVMHETQGLADGNLWSGHTLTVTRAGVTKTFSFPTDLPSTATAGKRVLIGSQGLAALGVVAPDYVMPNGFLATDGATLDYAGIDQISYPPLPADGINAINRTGVIIANVATNFAGAAAAVPALPVTAVEFRHAALDHYFISDLQPDIDALDSGRIAGWVRTGQSFKVLANPTSGGVNPVCRFSIPAAHGDSHFFSASPAECASIAQLAATDPNYSGYILESPAVFFVALPDTATGACPSATVPVYRLWNQRTDSNHRYTTSIAIKAQMIAQGYAAEGYGLDAVSMCTPPGTATLKVVAGAAAPYGALVSDGSSTPAANYQGYALPGDSVNVGTRSGNGEVIAFGVDRPVAIRPTVWATALADQLVTVPFASLLEIPITVWVVAGPFTTTQQTALTLWQTAQLYFTTERLGVRMTAIEIVNATTSPNAAAWSAFTCGAANANVAALKGDIGARAARINVYLVSLVDGSTSRGNACGVGGDFVAIASGAGAELLAHELGHDFGLEHIDDLVAAFNQANIMHSASNVRQYLTEGQTFRAHLRSSSAINQVYGLRPGQPTRDCDRDTLTPLCPAIGKRLWADGALPVN